MLFKRKRIPFIIPDDARELTDEEMILVNGGAEEKKESQESKSESVTVQSGNTLSGIVSDYNKANGTNYTVSEVAKNSGISNPHLIYPGQEIKFGNQGATGAGASSQNTIQSSPSISGNSTGSYSGSSSINNSTGITSSTLKSVSASTTTPSLESTKKLMYSKSLTGQSVSVDSCLSAPKYDDSTFKEKVENYMTQAESKKRGGKVVEGKMACGNRPEVKVVDGQNISSDSGNLRDRGYPSSMDPEHGIYSRSESIEMETSLEKIKKSVKQNENYKYNENGVRCDNWVEEVINDAGLDSTKYLPAGNSYAKNCMQHIEEAKKENSGFTTEVPFLDGAYVVFMGDGTYHSGPKEGQHANEHAALLIIENGSMTVWDNSLGNSTGGVDSTDVYALSNTRLSEFTLYESFYFRKID